MLIPLCTKTFAQLAVACRRKLTDLLHIIVRKRIQFNSLLFHDRDLLIALSCLYDCVAVLMRYLSE